MAIFGNQHSRRRSIDFAAVNDLALPMLPAILNRLAPGGKICSGEYIVKNPRRHDRRAGSFSVNINSGKWSDFATGDNGGDVVSLVAYLEGVNQPEAARILLQMSGRKP